MSQQHPVPEPPPATFGAAQCDHIKSDGNRCRLPALRGQEYCHYHTPSANTNLRDTRPAGRSFRPSSLLIASLQVTRLLTMRLIDPESAGMILYALELANIQLNSRRGGGRSTPVEPPPPQA